MTALPLFWGEGGPADIVQGQGARSPVLAALDASHSVLPLDILNAETLDGAKRLMLVQPSALRPEELVAVDDWVRKGGRILVFADPSLLWPSAMSMGDPRRAPVRSLLGPLLTHWGLTLNAPMADGPRVTIGTLAGRPASLAQPGVWSVAAKGCALDEAALVARCQIGAGQAILVADADLFDPRLWADTKIDNRIAITKLVAELSPN